jgi:hypothetical protein
MALAASSMALAAETDISYTGYLVDNLCIKMCDGEMLNSGCCTPDGVNVYKNPSAHSVHYLLDVSYLTPASILGDSHKE